MARGTAASTADGDTVSVTGAADVLASLPEQLKVDPGEVTAAVRLAADRLPGSARAIVDAVAAARTAGRLPARGLDDDFSGAPRTASSLAPALDGATTVPAAGTLSVALLARALMTVKGLEPISLGVDPTATDSATELLARRYLIRAGTGEWLSFDGAPVAPESVTALDAVALHANVLGWVALGALYVEDLDLASKASQQARALSRGDAALAFIAGQVQVASGLGDMGLGAMESAAALRADGRTWLTLGLTAMELSQPFKADQYLGRAAEADTSLVEPHLLQAQVDLERLQLVPKPQRPKVVEAVRAHLASAEAIDAEARGVRTIKAQIAALDGDLDAAETMLREEVKAHAADAGSWLDLASFLQGSEREREALELLQRATTEAGLTDPALQQTLGVLLVRDGQYADAVKALSSALEADPTDPSLRPQLAQLHKELGDVASARALLQEQLRLPGREDDRDARLLIAQLEMDAGDMKAAAANVEAVLAKQPTDPDANVLKYLISLRTNEQVDAARDAALKVVGKRSDLAQVLLEQGFPEAGEALLKDAIEEEPEDGLAPVLLSALLVATGRYAEAVELRDGVLAGIEDEDTKRALTQQFETAFSQARDAAKAAAKAEGTPTLEPPTLP